MILEPCGGLLFCEEAVELALMGKLQPLLCRPPGVVVLVPLGLALFPLLEGCESFRAKGGFLYHGHFVTSFLMMLLLYHIF